jgi:glycosyltransferase involved in cell wall biosynthesis
MKVSILIPVYNEYKTIMDVLDLVKGLETEKEIIIVDDRSTDGTRELLKKHFGDGSGDMRVLYHEANKGKGGAIRTALAAAQGDYVIVQDADMEYSPHDILKLARLAEEKNAAAVFGSRFLKTWRSTSFPHYMVNRFLTEVTNVLFGARLTDMETCYKMVRTGILRELDIKADGFEFEPEVTVKLLKKRIKIHEIPVSYRGRGYDEGKKITWKDGVKTLIVLMKLRLSR